MVWYFIYFYMIKRTFHEKFCISAWPCNNYPLCSFLGKPGHVIDCAVDIYAFGMCALEVWFGGIILITFIYLAIRIFRVSCCAGLRLWSLKENPVWPSLQCLISHVFLWRVTILCQPYCLWMLEIKWMWSLLQEVALLCGEGSVSHAWRRGQTPICFILSKKGSDQPLEASSGSLMNLNGWPMPHFVSHLVDGSPRTAWHRRSCAERKYHQSNSRIRTATSKGTVHACDNRHF